MQVQLHPTRREALTASETTLTRWELSTNPASVLAQVSTAPKSVFRRCYTCMTYPHTYGGITNSPDGVLFAHSAFPTDQSAHFADPGGVVWRSWDELAIVRTCPVSSVIDSLACSPDGRWLVVERTQQISHAPGASPCVERLSLLDWHTGEVISSHDISASFASSLAFDPTSTLVAAALYSYDDQSFPTLWRLTPAAQFLPRPAPRYFLNAQDYLQDEVSGSMALIQVSGGRALTIEDEPDHFVIDEDQERMFQEWSNWDITPGEALVTLMPCRLLCTDQWGTREERCVGGICW